jgi:trehalose 6-phosphate synthase/phosphatase
MLGANLVCFQTYSYSRHFISTCIRVCGYETTSRGIDVEGHVTAVMHCPVGIDAERVARDVTRPGIKPKLTALQNLYEGKKIIVGRDKLDVVKGVLQKLRAFEKLLQDYPEWVGNVVMIQVTSPALTDSPKLERLVSELVAHINGEFGSLDYIPVHHYHQTLKKDEFYALLSVADLAVITPLRDGMNTTSMEFVIAQQGTNKNPSVLSEFMGISKNMDQALLVNPWSLGDVAAAINQGLVMDPKEKAARHEKLYKVVTTHTSHTWAAVLVKMLLGQLGLQGMARKTPYIPRELLGSRYSQAKKRLFLFDYDVSYPSFLEPGQVLNTSEFLGHSRTHCARSVDGNALRSDAGGSGEALRGPAQHRVDHFWPRRRVPRAASRTPQEHRLQCGARWLRARAGLDGVDQLYEEPGHELDG